MSLPLAILCDLDGTLALLGERSPYDATDAINDILNNPVAHILQTYHEAHPEIALILISGREERYRPQTEKWLKQHGIQFTSLYLRKDRDFRKDTVIKTEIFRANVELKYTTLFVLEDRDQVVEMWRKQLGLTCLQVEYGAF
jgi:hydroxymethylpyrimidine pyrophosphatase-like HAD family hydrolase